MKEKTTKFVTVDVDKKMWKEMGIISATFGTSKKQILHEAISLWMAEWGRQEDAKKKKNEEIAAGIRARAGQ